MVIAAIIIYVVISIITFFVIIPFLKAKNKLWNKICESLHNTHSEFDNCSIRYSDNPEWKNCYELNSFKLSCVIAPSWILSLALVIIIVIVYGIIFALKALFNALSIYQSKMINLFTTKPVPEKMIDETKSTYRNIAFKK